MTDAQRLKRNARSRKQYNKNKKAALGRMRVYQQGEKFKAYSAEYRKQNGMKRSQYDKEYRDNMKRGKK